MDFFFITLIGILGISNVFSLVLLNRSRKKGLKALSSVSRDIATGTEKTYMALQHEIEERKNIEESLKWEKELIENIMRASPVGITVLDKNGQIFYANPKAEEVLGLSKDKITQRNYNAPQWKISDEFGNPFPEENLPFSRVKETLKPVNNVEHAIEWADGKRKLLSINAVPLFRNGEFQGAVSTIEDITLKKAVDRALRESRKTARALLNAITESALLLDREGRILEANEEVARRFHSTVPELIGRNAFDLLSGEVAAQRREYFQTVLETGKPVRFEDVRFGRILKNGMYPVTDLNGEINKVAVFAYDITETKVAEEKLKQSEKKYRNLVENMNEGMIVHDEKAVLTYVNPRFCEMLGLDEEQIIGRQLTDFLTIQARDRFLERFQSLHQAGIESFELNLKNSEGKEIFVMVSPHRLYNDDGQMDGCFAVLTDITEKKNIENSLREEKRKAQKYLDVAGVMMLVMDTRCRIQLINQKGAEILGYPESDIIGKNWVRNFIPKENRSQIEEVFNLLVNGKVEMGEHYENVIETAHGRRVIAWHNTILRNKEGDISGVLASGEDVTEIRKAREKANIYMTELERSNEELEQFAYVVSHDLQEPLRVISNYLQLIMKRYGEILDEKGINFINRSVNASKRMSEMIEDLLAFSRITTKPEPFESIDLKEIIKKALDNLHISIQEKNATIEYDKLPIVLGAQSQMIRVFQNLIGNALKFSREGVDPEIHIRSEEKNGKWLIRVEDNGIGIEPEYRDKIFEIFNRLHSRDKYPGTGIGLSVVKKIIERHGGKIWVESEVNRGSAFIFTLNDKQKMEIME
jgi:PAS domain S-box-containing protein